MLRTRRRTFGNIVGHAEGGGDLSSLSSWTAEQFDPRLSWDDVEWIKQRWGGKLIIKGILDVEDARLAVQSGADALIVLTEWNEFRGLDLARLSKSMRKPVLIATTLTAAALAETATPAVVDPHEHAMEDPAIVLAVLDPKGHVVAERGELADPDRGAESAGAKVEFEPLVGEFGQRLDIADDREIGRHQGGAEEIGHAQQPAVAEADRAKRVELRRQRHVPEGEQDAHHQAERNAEAHIFRNEVGEHLPHDADRAALAHHEVEQAQHLLEQQKHRRQHERGDERHEHLACNVEVDLLQHSLNPSLLGPISAPSRQQEPEVRWRTCVRAAGNSPNL